jgi:hypothetical protein
MALIKVEYTKVDSFNIHSIQKGNEIMNGDQILTFVQAEGSSVTFTLYDSVTNKNETLVFSLKYWAS